MAVDPMADQDPKASRQPLRPLATAARDRQFPAAVWLVSRRCSPQGKAAAEARLRAIVDPALGVLEYATKGKHKDLRGALTAARKYWCRAKPEANVSDWKRGLDWLSNRLRKRTERARSPDLSS